ncbi:MAG: hypothetical protein P4M11_08180 [Candidatus Pacebacteria bacterium]|nr:hypothetical protein [Candidatus Paceibacterota bacterium]
MYFRENPGCLFSSRTLVYRELFVTGGYRLAEDLAYLLNLGDAARLIRPSLSVCMIENLRLRGWLGGLGVLLFLPLVLFCIRLHHFGKDSAIL